MSRHDRRTALKFSLALLALVLWVTSVTLAACGGPPQSAGNPSLSPSLSASAATRGSVLLVCRRPAAMRTSSCRRCATRLVEAGYPAGDRQWGRRRGAGFRRVDRDHGHEARRCPSAARLPSASRSSVERGPAQYFDDAELHSLLRETVRTDKPVGAICLAPVILARAGLLQGREATVWSDDRDELDQAGCSKVGTGVVVDGTDRHCRRTRHQRRDSATLHLRPLETAARPDSNGPRRRASPPSDQSDSLPERPAARARPQRRALGPVSFVADLSSEIVYPIFPLLVTTVLGAPVAVLGLIEGVAEATASLTRYPFGRWSDNAGRRRVFVLSGYGLSALGKVFLALAFVWQVALTGRFVDRLGKGMRTAPRDALLAAGVRDDSAASPLACTGPWTRWAPCWGRSQRWRCCTGGSRCAACSRWQRYPEC